MSWLLILAAQLKSWDGYSPITPSMHHALRLVVDDPDFEKLSIRDKLAAAELAAEEIEERWERSEW